MQKTLISLSFDDGREDTYRTAYKIMRKYNLQGTLHITTGYVDGTWKPESWKTAKGPMTVGQLQELSDYGFEISSHGDKHIAEKNDLMSSINKLKSWGLLKDNIGFSIPTSKLSEAEREIFSTYLDTIHVAYMRGGRNAKCYSFLSKTYYVIYDITKIGLFYKLFNRHNCIDLNDTTINPFNLPAVVIRSGDKAKVITEFIKSNKNQWMIFMLHGIQSKNEDTYGKDPWCWDVTEFEKLCFNLNKMNMLGIISVSPILDVVKSYKEKNR